MNEKTKFIVSHSPNNVLNIEDSGEDQISSSEEMEAVNEYLAQE